MDDGTNYRTDVLYVPHYTRKLSPAFMRFALLLRGCDFPDRGPDEPFRYLELGFGRGYSLNIHAATNDGEFWGVDFLPGHCAAAQETAEAAGLDCRILQKSFAEVAAMAADGKLPLFDVIALHGVWSWVDAENRAHVLSILRLCLKKGGVAYVSYNALPGWSILMPVRDIMLGMMEEESDGDTETRIRLVVDRLAALAKTDGVYFKLNPLCGMYLEEMAKKPPTFLAHDFFNPTWQPFSFSDVARDMETVGCAFAASADLFTHADMCIPPDARAHVARASGPRLRETLRDFAMNTQFRADLFVRTSSPSLDVDQAWERLGDISLQTDCSPGGFPPEIDCGFTKIYLDAAHFEPLFSLLSADGGTAKKIRDCAKASAVSGEGRSAFAECLSVLCEAGLASPVVIDPPRHLGEASRRLNREICRQFFAGAGSADFLASPRHGGGYAVTAEDQALLHLRPESSDPAEWAGRIVGEMVARGLDRPHHQALQAEMKHIEDYIAQRMPILRKNGVEV